MEWLMYVSVVMEGFLLIDSCVHIYRSEKGYKMGWVSAAVAWSCLLMTDVSSLMAR